MVSQATDKDLFGSVIPKRIQGLKAYIPGISFEQMEREYGLTDIIKLSSNENPLGPSPQAIVAAQEAVTQCHRYPDAQANALRESLAKRYRLNKDNIIVGNGSEAIIASIVRAFLEEGDEVLTSDSAFAGFPILCRTRGFEPVTSPLKDYGFDLESLAKKVKPDTKLIYLCNPNNPTGTIFSRQEFEHFMTYVADRTLVILDEAYFEYAESSPNYPDSMDYRYDNVITLRTFSKAYGLAGFRVGYGFGHPQLIESLWKIKLPFEPGKPSQAAAVAALDDKEFLSASVAYVLEQREVLEEAFSRWEVTLPPSCTNFFLVDFGSSARAEHWFDKLIRQGIVVRALGEGSLSGCLRISVGTKEENQQLIRACQEIYEGEKV